MKKLPENSGAIFFSLDTLFLDTIFLILLLIFDPLSSVEERSEVL